MNKKEIVGVLAIVLFLTITFTLLAYSYYQVLDKVTYNADVMVVEKGEKMGFIIDTDGLRFGRVPKNAVPKRELLIRNTWDESVVVSITKHGKLKDWISLESENFQLMRGESRSIDVYLHVPAGTNLGSYTGKVDVVFLRN